MYYDPHNLSPAVVSFVKQFTTLYEKNARVCDFTGSQSVVPGTPIFIGLLKGLTKEIITKGRVKGIPKRTLTDALTDLVGVTFDRLHRHDDIAAIYAAVSSHSIRDAAPHACFNVVFRYEVQRRVPDIAFGGFTRTVGDQAIIPVDFVIAAMRELRLSSLPVNDAAMERRVVASHTVKLWANLVFPVLEHLIANPKLGEAYDDDDD